MTDQWVPAPPIVPVPPPVGIPPSNAWNPASGCADPNAPSIVPGIVISGVPATILSPYAWGITLNDGAGPPNFTIDHYDGTGALIEHTLEFFGTDGSARFSEPVTAPALTITTGQLTIPDVGHLTIPGGPIGTYLGPVSPSGSLAWFQLPTPPIPADAPTDGNLYGRVNGAWSSGGVFTQPLYISGSNGLALIGPAGSQRSILAGTGTSTSPSWRWQMLLADQTAESGGNAGSNFALNAISDGGSLMPGPPALAITRATNAATFGGTVTAPGQIGGASAAILVNKASGQNAAIGGQMNGSLRWTLSLADPSAELGGNFGSNFVITRYTDAGVSNGVAPLNINRQTGNAVFGYGVTVTGVLTLATPANLFIGGGSADQVLTTNGSGGLFWSTVTGGGAGGVDEAPEDGTTYARNNATWVHLTSADITDWAAQLANYYPTSNPAGYQTAAQVGTMLQGYLPLTAGPSAPLTGPLFSSQYVMLTGVASNVRAVVGATAANLPRWAAYYGDNATESGGNAGSNFLLQSYNDLGGPLAQPLSITRAGLATFSTLPSFPGGTSGQALTTNGAGLLSWAGPYALPASVPNPSTTLPLADGAAAVGTATTYARADHVHPVVFMGDNRIINGDMLINQRGVESGTANGYIIDRWQYNGMSGNQITWNHGIDAVGGPVQAIGFPRYMNFTGPATAYTPAAGDSFSFFQIIEADWLSDFAWGTSKAQPVTLSFWASASVAGTYSGSLCSGTTPYRSYPFTFSILTAGVMTKIVINIPGDSVTGTWALSGNGVGLFVRFDLGCGANTRGPAGAWVTANYIGVTGSIAIVSNASAGLSITGVKLEIGSVATPFNRQSLAKSLADCQRYYQVLPTIEVTGFPPTANSTVSTSISFQSMRAAPTAALANITYSPVGSAFAVGSINNNTMQCSVTISTAGYGWGQADVRLSAEL